MTGPPEIPPQPDPGPPPAAYVQLEPATRAIAAWGTVPFDAAPPGYALDVVMDPDEAAKLREPGIKVLETSGVVTVTPPPPPPVRYLSTVHANLQIRTTDATVTEIFRFPTEIKHLYRGTFQLVAVDAGTGVAKDQEARMTFKRGTGASPAQIGSTTVLYGAQDAGAASWSIGATIDGADLVFSIQGAAGRTIDWHLLGQVVRYAPDGVE